VKNEVKGASEVLLFCANWTCNQFTYSNKKHWKIYDEGNGKYAL